MKYIMIWPYGWFDQYMYQDMVDAQRMTPYPLRKPCASPVLNFIRRVHQSYKINRLVHLPCQEIWYSSLFEKIDRDTCVIFCNGALGLVGISFLEKIRAAGARMVLVLVDSLHGSSIGLIKAKPNIFGFSWDVIFSYDKHDCKEYGFRDLQGNMYSKLTDVKPAVMSSDLYFVGTNKAHRHRVIEEIHRRCVRVGIETDFHCIDYPGVQRKPYMKNPPGLHYWKRSVPYPDVVSHVLSTNCILEVVGKGQQVQTARYYEAVCYNKKLLTNNPTVKELSFYDPRYMRYFETVEDIDFSWVKEKIDVDYHYAGEFSPLHILDELDEMFAVESGEARESALVKGGLENRGGNGRSALGAMGLPHKTRLAAA